MKNINKVLDILEETYPDAKCELDYTTPFELLVATILSAQCTDVRVNKVTGEMFKKYNTPMDFAKLSIDEIQEEIKTCGLYKSKAEKIKQKSGSRHAYATEWDQSGRDFSLKEPVAKGRTKTYANREYDKEER